MGGHYVLATGLVMITVVTILNLTSAQESRRFPVAQQKTDSLILRR